MVKPTQYQILIRQKRARGGTLEQEEQRSLDEAKLDELVRRHDALYGRGLLRRRFTQLGCAIRDTLKWSN